MEHGMAEEPLILGIETSCDETGWGWYVVAPPCGHGGHVGRRARPVRRCRARDREPGASGGHAADVGSRLPGCGCPLDRCRRCGSHRRSRSGGGAAGGNLGRAGDRLGSGGPAYPVNHLAAHVAVDRLSTVRLPRPRCRCWYPVGIPRCCWSRMWRPRSRRWVPPGRRRRRSVRQGGPVARVCRSRRPAHRPGGFSGRSDRHRLPARADRRQDQVTHRHDFSFSGLKTAVARWVESERQRAGRSMWPRSLRRSRRRSGCAHPRRLLLPADNTTERNCRSGRGRREFAPAGFGTGTVRAGRHRLRVPRPDLCTDNGAMVASPARPWSKPGATGRASRSIPARRCRRCCSAGRFLRQSRQRGAHVLLGDHRGRAASPGSGCHAPG